MNKKITALDPLGTTPATDDVLPIVDVSGTATTKKVTVANLVAAAPQGDLVASNNLSDVASASTSRTNLGLGTAAVADTGTSNGNVVVLDATGLPAVDGSQLTGISTTDSTKLAIASNLSDLNNAATARTNLGLGTAATTASTDYATAAQGATADSATQPSDNISTLTNDSNFIDSSGAPVQSVAGRTGTVTLSNTDVSGLGTAALLDSGTSSGNVVVLDGVGLPAVDGSQLTGISTAVDGTAVTSTGETGATKFLREDGDGTCSFQTVAITDGNLRGTDNPHIGAFPNQSLKVIDNPSGSVLVVTDSDGNLDFVVKTDTSKAYLNTPSGRLELTTGVSVVEDATEPDIEITTTSGTYSLITGDSDVLGANGLPQRQGFNAPDIGANPAPLLISGGTIS